MVNQKGTAELTYHQAEVQEPYSGTGAVQARTRDLYSEVEMGGGSFRQLTGYLLEIRARNSYSVPGTE